MSLPLARPLSLFVAIPLFAAALPLALHAQRRALEIGTDAHLVHRRVTFESNGTEETQSATQLQLPTGIRAGFFLTPRTSVELNLTLDYVNSGDGDLTSMTVSIGPMIHLSTDQTHRQGYVRPFLGLNYVNSHDTDSQLFFGGALGLKVPVRTHAAMRYEVLIQRGEQHFPFPRETRFGIAAGFSLFFP